MSELQVAPEYRNDVITPSHIDRWLFIAATLVFLARGAEASSIAIEKAESLFHQLRQKGY